ncbi:hypothetical protein TRFO_32659 [Tritrichomonas foetus]|uniref:Uncharacterized protein n=1 Tax=Tritrichomonas foetus TaxID=1144522 RepID=A0A1J4JND2_9EUKA|nr:hypothetical protein TRFO_32659 [Tritrichomonas foetus]|eukprot:OHT00633.1 hypothetical protein TRFO_32659 [Tritrichomonas foetus]
MKQIPSPDRTKIRLNSTTTSIANSLESPHSKFSSSINDDSIIELREQVFDGLAFSKIPDKKLRLLIIHLKQYIKHEVSIGNDFNAKLGEMKLRSLRKELKFRQNPASAKDKEEDIYQKEYFLFFLTPDGRLSLNFLIRKPKCFLKNFKKFMKKKFTICVQEK